MSRTLSTAALLVTLVIPAVARGQIGFGVAAGVAQPVGDFHNVATAGPTFSGLVNLSIPLAPVGLRFEGTYAQFGRNTLSSSGGNARIYSATANAMFSTPGIIGPYVIGGLGYYHSTSLCSACSNDSNKVGYNAGVGLRAGLFGFSAFAEARFHHIPGASAASNGVLSSTQFIPVTVGVTF